VEPQEADAFGEQPVPVVQPLPVAKPEEPRGGFLPLGARLDTAPEAGDKGAGKPLMFGGGAVDDSEKVMDLVTSTVEDEEKPEETTKPDKPEKTKPGIFFVRVGEAGVIKDGKIATCHVSDCIVVVLTDGSGTVGLAHIPPAIANTKSKGSIKRFLGEFVKNGGKVQSAELFGGSENPQSIKAVALLKAALEESGATVTINSEKINKGLGESAFLVDSKTGRVQEFAGQFPGVYPKDGGDTAGKVLDTTGQVVISQKREGPALAPIPPKVEREVEDAAMAKLGELGIEEVEVQFVMVSEPDAQNRFAVSADTARGTYRIVVAEENGKYRVIGYRDNDDELILTGETLPGEFIMKKETSEQKRERLFNTFIAQKEPRGALMSRAHGITRQERKQFANRLRQIASMAPGFWTTKPGVYVRSADLLSCAGQFENGDIDYETLNGMLAPWGSLKHRVENPRRSLFSSSDREFTFDLAGELEGLTFNGEKGTTTHTVFHPESSIFSGPPMYEKVTVELKGARFKKGVDIAKARDILKNDILWALSIMNDNESLKEFSDYETDKARYGKALHVLRSVAPGSLARALVLVKSESPRDKWRFRRMGRREATSAGERDTAATQALEGLLGSAASSPIAVASAELYEHAMKNGNYETAAAILDSGVFEVWGRVSSFWESEYAHSPIDGVLKPRLRDKYVEQFKQWAGGQHSISSAGDLFALTLNDPSVMAPIVGDLKSLAEESEQLAEFWQGQRSGESGWYRSVGGYAIYGMSFGASDKFTHPGEVMIVGGEYAIILSTAGLAAAPTVGLGQGATLAGAHGVRAGTSALARQALKEGAGFVVVDGVISTGIGVYKDLAHGDRSYSHLTGIMERIPGDVAMGAGFRWVAGGSPVASATRSGRDITAKAGTKAAKPRDVLRSIKRPDHSRGGVLVDDPIAQAILKSSNADDILRAIPDGCVPVGSGRTAIALKTPDGHVIRIEQGTVSRPKVGEMLQAKETKHIGGWTVEKLPFASAGEVTVGDIAKIKKSLARKGFTLGDDFADNLGKLPNGEIKVIDPGAISPVKSGARTLKRVIRPVAPPAKILKPVTAGAKAAAKARIPTPVKSGKIPIPVSQDIPKNARSFYSTDAKLVDELIASADPVSIGRGDFCRVYSVNDKNLVIKVLQREQGIRFGTQAESLADIGAKLGTKSVKVDGVTLVEVPGCARTRFIGDGKGRIIMVQEKLNMPSVAELMKNAKVRADITGAREALHEKGVWFDRNIENFGYTKSGTVVLHDFGGTSFVGPEGVKRLRVLRKKLSDSFPLPPSAKTSQGLQVGAKSAKPAASSARGGKSSVKPVVRPPKPPSKTSALTGGTRRPEFGKPGGRIAGGEAGKKASQEYLAKEGWKLHLAVDPKNPVRQQQAYKVIDKWLHENHTGQYKLLTGGDAGMSDFTVYVGSGKRARDFAMRIERELSDWLVNSTNLPTDLAVTPKVCMRFDVKGAKGLKGKYYLYGKNGIPFDHPAGEARLSLNIQLRHMNPEGVRLHKMWVNREIRRIHNELSGIYGEYYTAGFEQGAFGGGPQADFDTRIDLITSVIEDEGKTSVSPFAEDAFSPQASPMILPERGEKITGAPQELTKDALEKSGDLTRAPPRAFDRSNPKMQSAQSIAMTVFGDKKNFTPEELAAYIKQNLPDLPDTDIGATIVGARSAVDKIDAFHEKKESLPRVELGSAREELEAKLTKLNNNLFMPNGVVVRLHPEGVSVYTIEEPPRAVKGGHALVLSDSSERHTGAWGYAFHDSSVAVAFKDRIEEKTSERVNDMVKTGLVDLSGLVPKGTSEKDKKKAETVVSALFSSAAKTLVGKDKDAHRVLQNIDTLRKGGKLSRTEINWMKGDAAKSAIGRIKTKLTEAWVEFTLAHEVRHLADVKEGLRLGNKTNKNGDKNVANELSAMYATIAGPSDKSKPHDSKLAIAVIALSALNIILAPTDEEEVIKTSDYSKAGALAIARTIKNLYENGHEDIYGKTVGMTSLLRQKAFGGECNYELASSLLELMAALEGMDSKAIEQAAAARFQEDFNSPIVEPAADTLDQKKVEAAMATVNPAIEAAINEIGLGLDKADTALDAKVASAEKAVSALEALNDPSRDMTLSAQEEGLAALKTMVGDLKAQTANYDKLSTAAKTELLSRVEALEGLLEAQPAKAGEIKRLVGGETTLKPQKESTVCTFTVDGKTVEIKIDKDSEIIIRHPDPNLSNVEIEIRNARVIVDGKEKPRVEVLSGKFRVEGTTVKLNNNGEMTGTIEKLDFNATEYLEVNNNADIHFKGAEVKVCIGEDPEVNMRGSAEIEKVEFTQRAGDPTKYDVDVSQRVDNLAKQLNETEESFQNKVAGAEARAKTTEIQLGDLAWFNPMNIPVRSKLNGVLEKEKRAVKQDKRALAQFRRQKGKIEGQLQRAKDTSLSTKERLQAVREARSLVGQTKDIQGGRVNYRQFGQELAGVEKGLEYAEYFVEGVDIAVGTATGFVPGGSLVYSGAQNITGAGVDIASGKDVGETLVKRGGGFAIDAVIGGAAGKIVGTKPGKRLAQEMAREFEKGFIRRTAKMMGEGFVNGALSAGTAQAKRAAEQMAGKLLGGEEEAMPKPAAAGKVVQPDTVKPKDIDISRIVTDGSDMPVVVLEGPMDAMKKPQASPVDEPRPVEPAPALEIDDPEPQTAQPMPAKEPAPQVDQPKPALEKPLITAEAVKEVIRHKQDIWYLYDSPSEFTPESIASKLEVSDKLAVQIHDIAVLAIEKFEESGDITVNTFRRCVDAAIFESLTPAEHVKLFKNQLVKHILKPAASQKLSFGEVARTVQARGNPHVERFAQALVESYNKMFEQKLAQAGDEPVSIDANEISTLVDKAISETLADVRTTMAEPAPVAADPETDVQTIQEAANILARNEDAITDKLMTQGVQTLVKESRLDMETIAIAILHGMSNEINPKDVEKYNSDGELYDALLSLVVRLLDNVKEPSLEAYEAAAKIIVAEYVQMPEQAEPEAPVVPEEKAVKRPVLAEPAAVDEPAAPVPAPNIEKIEGGIAAIEAKPINDVTQKDIETLLKAVEVKASPTPPEINVCLRASNMLADITNSLGERPDAVKFANEIKEILVKALNENKNVAVRGSVAYVLRMIPASLENEDKVAARAMATKIVKLLKETIEEKDVPATVLNHVKNSLTELEMLIERINAVTMPAPEPAVPAAREEQLAPKAEKPALAEPAPVPQPARPEPKPVADQPVPQVEPAKPQPTGAIELLKDKKKAIRQILINANTNGNLQPMTAEELAKLVQEGGTELKGQDLIVFVEMCGQILSEIKRNPDWLVFGYGFVVDAAIANAEEKATKEAAPVADEPAQPAPRAELPGLEPAPADRPAPPAAEAAKPAQPEQANAREQLTLAARGVLLNPAATGVQIYTALNILYDAGKIDKDQTVDALAQLIKDREITPFDVIVALKGNTGDFAISDDFFALTMKEAFEKASGRAVDMTHEEACQIAGIVRDSNMTPDVLARAFMTAGSLDELMRNLGAPEGALPKAPEAAKAGAQPAGPQAPAQPKPAAPRAQPRAKQQRIDDRQDLSTQAAGMSAEWFANLHKFYKTVNRNGQTNGEALIQKHGADSGYGRLVKAIIDMNPDELDPTKKNPDQIWAAVSAKLNTVGNTLDPAKKKEFESAKVDLLMKLFIHNTQLSEEDGVWGNEQTGFICTSACGFVAACYDKIKDPGTEGLQVVYVGGLKGEAKGVGHVALMDTNGKIHEPAVRGDMTKSLKDRYAETAGPAGINGVTITYVDTTTNTLKTEHFVNGWKDDGSLKNAAQAANMDGVSPDAVQCFEVIKRHHYPEILSLIKEGFDLMTSNKPGDKQRGEAKLQEALTKMDALKAEFNKINDPKNVNVGHVKGLKSMQANLTVDQDAAGKLTVRGIVQGVKDGNLELDSYTIDSKKGQVEIKTKGMQAPINFGGQGTLPMVPQIPAAPGGAQAPGRPQGRMAQPAGQQPIAQPDLRQAVAQGLANIPGFVGARFKVDENNNEFAVFDAQGKVVAKGKVARVNGVPAMTDFRRVVHMPGGSAVISQNLLVQGQGGAFAIDGARAAKFDGLLRQAVARFGLANPIDVVSFFAANAAEGEDFGFIDRNGNMQFVASKGLAVINAPVKEDEAKRIADHCARTQGVGCQMVIITLADNEGNVKKGVIVRSEVGKKKVRDIKAVGTLQNGMVIGINPISVMTGKRIDPNKLQAALDQVKIEKLPNGGMRIERPMGDTNCRIGMTVAPDGKPTFNYFIDATGVKNDLKPGQAIGRPGGPALGVMNTTDKTGRAFQADIQEVRVLKDGSLRVTVEGGIIIPVEVGGKAGAGHKTDEDRTNGDVMVNDSTSKEIQYQGRLELMFSGQGPVAGGFHSLHNAEGGKIRLNVGGNKEEIDPRQVDTALKIIDVARGTLNIQDAFGNPIMNNAQKQGINAALAAGDAKGLVDALGSVAGRLNAVSNLKKAVDVGNVKEASARDFIKEFDAGKVDYKTFATLSMAAAAGAKGAFLNNGVLDHRVVVGDAEIVKVTRAAQNGGISESEKAAKSILKEAAPRFLVSLALDGGSIDNNAAIAIISGIDEGHINVATVGKLLEDAVNKGTIDKNTATELIAAMDQGTLDSIDLTSLILGRITKGAFYDDVGDKLNPEAAIKDADIQKVIAAAKAGGMDASAAEPILEEASARIAVERARTVEKDPLPDNLAKELIKGLGYKDKTNNDVAPTISTSVVAALARRRSCTGKNRRGCIP